MAVPAQVVLFSSLRWAAAAALLAISAAQLSAGDVGIPTVSGVYPAQVPDAESQLRAAYAELLERIATDESSRRESREKVSQARFDEPAQEPPHPAGKGPCCDESTESCSDDSLGEPCTLMGVLCGDEDPCFTIAGWTEWGYSNRSDGVINVHPHHLDNHQSWLYAEREADGSEGWDWGFRVDLVYGTDGPDTQAFGNPPGTFDYLNGWDHGIYGWAMPQLYASAAYHDFSVIAGHFYSKQGYEGFSAPESFFFSHSLTWNFNEPFTHTGFLASYNLTETTAVHAGWTAGLDTGFQQLDGGSCVHAGMTSQATEDIQLSYWTCAGNFGYRGDGYLHAIVAEVGLTDKWNYVFHSDLTTTNSGSGGLGDHQFAIVNYLFYTISDCLKAGGRAEWWKTGGESLYEVTGGFNIQPHANLVFRPEIRYQWASSAATAAALAVPIDHVILAVNAVVTF